MGLDFRDMERYFGEGAKIGSRIFLGIAIIVFGVLYFFLSFFNIDKFIMWLCIILILILSLFVINRIYKKKITLGVVIIVILLVLFPRPYQFDEDSGPSSAQTWRVNETKNEITLLKIIEHPFSAEFEYNGTIYRLTPNKWTTIGNHTLKIRIYPDKGYVWAIWK